MGHFIRSLGRAHAIDLLHLLKENSDGLKFNQIKNALCIDAKTSVRRLRELQEAGFIQSVQQNESSTYRISPKGIRVLEFLKEIGE